MRAGSARNVVKSARGFFAAIVFLLALPVAALCQLVVGRGAEPTMHFMLALGSGLLAASVANFRTPRFAAWLGRLCVGALAAIFLVQGASELVHNTALTNLAFQTLGQRLESWLVSGFLLWCVAVLVVDSHGKTRLFGLLAVAITASARVYAASVEATAPQLKLLYLMPFVWLLLESKSVSHHPLMTQGAP